MGVIVLAENRRRTVVQSGGSIDIASDIKALNSSILIISQKMKYLVRNEKILSRNLLVLSKRIKELEEMVANGSAKKSESAEDSGVISKRIGELNDRLFELEQKIPSKEELAELRYLVESINPLEFVTIKQVNELVEKKLRELRK